MLSSENAEHESLHFAPAPHRPNRDIYERLTFAVPSAAARQPEADGKG